MRDDALSRIVDLEFVGLSSVFFFGISLKDDGFGRHIGCAYIKITDTKAYRLCRVGTLIEEVKSVR